MFHQHCSSGWGGHKIFDHQIGGSQNIAEVLSEIHDPPIPKKMVAPLPSLDGVYNNGVEVHEPGANCYRKVTTLYSPRACLYCKT